MEKELFSVAAVFSDNCVLQRNKEINVFGYCTRDYLVKITLKNQTGEILAEKSEKTKSDENGKWIITLPPQSAADNCTLEIAAEAEEITKIIFNNIAIGEVWLAGGQSNMEFELQNCTEGPDELANVKQSKVRFYYTNKIAWKDDHFYEAERNTCWQTWESEWKTAWSAVGYFFGNKLAQDLDCTVGIIGCNWGGTSASAWMRKEYLENDSELNTYIEEQIEATKGKSVEQQCAEYDDYEIKNAQWQEKCNQLYATVPGIEWDEVQNRIGPCLWPGPRSCKNPYRPTGLYDCMLSRILPYTLKGVIWYQGESDDHKPLMYEKLFTKMIENWREDWHDEQLPFVYVQLPLNRYKNDKDFKHWCLVREAQEKTSLHVKNAFMTCAFDLGQYNDIHPKAKRTIGERMEKVAMAKVYNSGKIDFALLDKVEKEGKKLILSFVHAPETFELRDSIEELKNYTLMEKIQGNEVATDFNGFEIAAADEKYVPAKVEILKEGKLAVWADQIENPEMARYGWYNYGPVTVFTNENLPLPPFRTNQKNQDKKTEHAEIQQIMTV